MKTEIGTISSKGQILLPFEIRKKLDLKEYEGIEIITPKEFITKYDRLDLPK